MPLYPTGDAELDELREQEKNLSETLAQIVGNERLAKQRLDEIQADRREFQKERDRVRAAIDKQVEAKHGVVITPQQAQSRPDNTPRPRVSGQNRADRPKTSQQAIDQLEAKRKTAQTGLRMKGPGGVSPAQTGLSPAEEKLAAEMKAELAARKGQAQNAFNKQAKTKTRRRSR